MNETYRENVSFERFEILIALIIRGERKLKSAGIFSVYEHLRITEAKSKRKIFRKPTVKFIFEKIYATFGEEESGISTKAPYTSNKSLSIYPW